MRRPSRRHRPFNVSPPSSFSACLNWFARHLLGNLYQVCRNLQSRPILMLGQHANADSASEGDHRCLWKDQYTSVPSSVQAHEYVANAGRFSPFTNSIHITPGPTTTHEDRVVTIPMANRIMRGNGLSYTPIHPETLARIPKKKAHSASTAASSGSAMPM